MLGDEHRCVFEETLAVHGAGLSRRLNINTHLLPDGSHTLILSLVTPQGETVRADPLTFTVNNQGPVGDKVKQSLISYKTPLVVSGPLDSSLYDYADRSLTPWFDRPDAPRILAAMSAEGKITAEEETALCISSPKVISSYRSALRMNCRGANREIDDAVQSGWGGYKYGSSQRIEQLHQKYPAIRAAATSADFSLSRLAVSGFRQTLSDFDLCVRQSARRASRPDPSHSVPRRLYVRDLDRARGRAARFRRTRDLAAESPAAAYLFEGHGLPESAWRRLARFGEPVVSRWRRMATQNGLEKVTYRPKRGTVLIWHENLLHAGSVRKDLSLSRAPSSFTPLPKGRLFITIRQECPDRLPA